ncbi:uncharacterized protein LOC131178322 [Hevea brasiliensis]|uniref:uncharacterized protein LOC131178322 n=1 Tax=Hevea brasiliensis TaxID=3981 RepID=UPI0025FE272D|nr:uncharacterized protein LOC131178322 [Hevea brasiliensis]
MVKFALKITAKLENATDLQPAGGADNGRPYLFKLQCTTCQAVSDNHICLSTSDPSSTTYKCKGCNAQGSASLVIGYGQPVTKSGQYATLMHVNCDGFEPEDFTFSGDWACRSVVDGKYHEFQFTDGKFKKEEDQIKMIISNLEATFVVDRT